VTVKDWSLRNVRKRAKRLKRELSDQFYCVKCRRTLPRDRIYLTIRYERDFPVGICIPCKRDQIGRIIEPSSS
jgi:hypothetical protein